ncbi:MAG: 1-deoxy-D-xylulose-5-phosphate synthase [Treponema sp.]|nr:1-deoxy-D-xylulose-5-phosphate synthase [Treponema sp.]
MLLQNINSPDDLKKLAPSSLKLLSQELRDVIIRTVGKNGGHLASNLGAVELTVALHRVFNSPQDAIVWDVSHQSYSHKLLTGRYKDFPGIRQKGGISGFTRISESPHDYFDAGHASSSISSALGLLSAWRLQGRNDKVAVVIGDGALTGGMAYEALNHAGQLAKNLIVIVNDNKMSISPNTGSVSRYLSQLTSTAGYQNFRYKIDRLVDDIPYINRKLGKFIYRFKRGLKGLLLTNNLFVDLGFEYLGPLNGHNIQQLERMFRRAMKMNRPVVIHVITKKGKGYSPAEHDPATFHGVGPFSISDGLVEKFDTVSFTEVFSRKIVDMAAENPRICAITAAMSKGTGLDAFSRRYKNRFFDVGIAEEHAVTFAGGLAAGGMVPVVAIYSTFIQRSVDQIIEDIALQNRHVILVFDRAGAVPADGETHQGIFDIALLRPIPGMTLMTVSSEKDMELCLDWAVTQTEGPVAIRWPKMSCPSEIPAFAKPVMSGRGILVKSSDFAPTLSVELEDTDTRRKRRKPSNILLVCTGSMYSETQTAARQLLLGGSGADIYILRFLKPFDESYFISIAEKYAAIVFIEDGVHIGGMAEYLESLISRDKRRGSKAATAVLSFPDHFLSNGNREQILEEALLSPGHIAATAQGLAHDFQDKSK